MKKEINGKSYSYEELRAIYKFFTNSETGYESLPNYCHLVEIGFTESSKECLDLSVAYNKLAGYEAIMSITDGKACKLAEMYKRFRYCLPYFLDEHEEKVVTRVGCKLKELEDCNDQEILKSVQKMYDEYMEDKHNSFMESLRNILSKGEEK